MKHCLRVSALFFAATLMLMASPSMALQGVGGRVTSLRVEGPFGFIGVPEKIPNCGYRVWLDMNSALHRSMYATAMLAFSTGKTIYLRAADDGTRVFGECPIYDILVAE